ncbi:MAG TPA: tRNA (adenosine(37)-N6)-threonylcarbamoyltransferase complex ATPase subunit type 1 TsaE [Anaerolineaceae bacterium]|jgi:tRNA threonylcarbamoyladenosine biosynthesis protein TsaE
MPILDANSLEFFSHGSEQTRRVGIRLGTLLLGGDVICLSGDLGAGKTTLVQGIAKGWGSLDSVSSPTFVLVNSYRRPDGQRLNHLDAYRLKDALEAEDLDLIFLMDQGPLVVEWPERIESIIPAQRFWIAMRWLADEQRGMVFTAQGARYQRLLIDFKRCIYGGV